MNSIERHDELQEELFDNLQQASSGALGPEAAVADDESIRRHAPRASERELADAFARLPALAAEADSDDDEHARLA